MRRIGLDTLIPDLKRLVGDCNREELLAVAQRQREIEKTHADALSRSARSGSSAPAEAYETAWRTHCRAYVYAALAEPLPPDMPARELWQPAQVAEIWEQGCASAGVAPWQVHAATVKVRDGDRSPKRDPSLLPTRKRRLSKDDRFAEEAAPATRARPARNARPGAGVAAKPDAKAKFGFHAKPGATARPGADGKPGAGGKPGGARPGAGGKPGFHAKPSAGPGAGAKAGPRGRPNAEGRPSAGGRPNAAGRPGTGGGPSGTGGRTDRKRPGRP